MDSECDEKKAETFMYSLVAGFWFSIFMIWIINNHCINYPYSSTLHHWLTGTLLFRFLLSFFSFLVINSCSTSEY